MRRQWCGLTAIVLSVAVSAGVGPRGTVMAAAPPPPPTALAYVANGQVAVIEAGNLTVAGPGQNPAWSPNAANLLFDTPDLIANIATIYVADSHGANTRVLVSKAYPVINPVWSPDSKYVVYTAPVTGAKVSGHTIRLQVKATSLANKSTRVLGQFNFTAGCSSTASALQDTFTKAQGGYHGTPTTLIWAEPSHVAVQLTCTGQGITLFSTAGGTARTLATWSGGVLSPDGKSIIAAVAGASGAAGKVGVLNVASGATQVSTAKISPSVFAWGSNSKVVFAAAQPADPSTGSATVYRMSPDAKLISVLGQVRAAGVFHLSVSHLQDFLTMAVVSSAAKNAQAPPTTFVSSAQTLVAGTPAPLVPGFQPAWRP